MIKEHEIIWAIQDGLESLPFKPTARELTAAIGWLLMHWGEKLARANSPELNPLNISEVDKHYMMQPTYATAMILQGHLMRNIWTHQIEEGEGYARSINCPGLCDGEDTPSSDSGNDVGENQGRE